MDKEKFVIKTKDGLLLKGYKCVPNTFEKVILLIHGIGEHSARYEHVAEFFYKQGIAFYTFDQRGHGLSDGKRGVIPGYDAFFDDIDEMLYFVANDIGKAHITLYGHSMGGGEVLGYILKRKPGIDAVIASAPMIKLGKKPKFIKHYAAKLLRNILPDIVLKRGTPSKDLSHDGEVVYNFDHDPLNHYVISPRMYMDMLDNGQYILDYADCSNLPILVMHGDLDKVTSYKASYKFSELAGSNCLFKAWPGFYHELHNEENTEDVLGYVLEWLNCL